MFKRFRNSAMIAVLIIPALMISGCNFGGKKAKGDQVLNLSQTQEPPNLDSAKSTDTVSTVTLNNTQEGLYRIGEKDELVLGMAADKPVISADKKIYTFKLRDAKWSDGKPVTAHDFVYGIKRVLEAKTASEYAYMNYYVKNGQAFNKGQVSADAVGVKAIDAKTLEITLDSPVAYFEKLLAFTTYFPQRQDIVEKYGAKYGQEASNMVYNGPFILSEWKHSERLQYKPNEHYWDKEAVKLKEVNLSIVKETATSLNLYKTGKLDVTPLDAEFADVNKNNPEKVVLLESSTSHIELNTKNKLLQNAKIRKALSLGINRKALVESVLKDGSIPAGGVVPPSIKSGDQSFRDAAALEAQFNPGEAKKLWAEGLRELGMQNPAKIDLLGVNDSARKKILEFVQSQLRTNVGANIEITAVPFKQRLDRQKAGQFELAMGGWMADYNDPMTFLGIFTSKASFNYGRWNNATYDSLLEKAEENTVENRLQDLVKAEKVLIDETGVVPLYYKSKLALVRKSVKGIVWHAVGPEYELKWAYISE